MGEAKRRKALAPESYGNNLRLSLGYRETKIGNHVLYCNHADFAVGIAVDKNELIAYESKLRALVQRFPLDCYNTESWVTWLVHHISELPDIDSWVTVRKRDGELVKMLLSQARSIGLI
jgi:hypothetical protein